MPRTGRGKSKDKDKPHKNTGSAGVRKDFNPKTNAAMSAFRKDEERKINREIARNATNKEFRSDPYLGDEMSKEQSDRIGAAVGRRKKAKVEHTNKSKDIEMERIRRRHSQGMSKPHMKDEGVGLEKYINELASAERSKKRKGTSLEEKEIPDFPY